MDDIIVYNETLEDHLTHFRGMLGRLREHSLYLKKEKSEFRPCEVRFLGRIVGNALVKMGPKKVQAILD